MNRRQKTMLIMVTVARSAKSCSSNQEENFDERVH